MNKYKTYEELKEELGDKFEEFMYKANIELLTKIDKAIEYIEDKGHHYDSCFGEGYYALEEEEQEELLEILKGDNNDN